MTYGEWLEAETRKECDRETIAKKLKRGSSPEWIHEEENFSMELIQEVQACMESKEGEMYESIMERPQGRNTAIEKVSEENTSLFNSMIKLETCRKDYTDAIRRDYARERITMKFRKGYTPSYIHKEDGYPIELVLEVKKALEATGEIVNEELELDCFQKGESLKTMNARRKTKAQSTSQTGRFEGRLFDLSTAAAYISLGETRAREWLTKIGAKRKFGAAVRYDRNVIDRALDAMEADDSRDVQC